MSSMVFFQREEKVQAGKPRCIILTSHKVMFSTMIAQENYNWSSANFLNHLPNMRYLKWLQPFVSHKQERGACFYIISRNPYDRLLSLYRNILMYPLDTDGYMKQTGQLMLMSCIISMCRGVSFNRIAKNELLKVSFEEFMLSIRKVLADPVARDYFLHEEEHTKLQSCELYFKDINVPRALCRISMERMLKMEDPEDMAFLRDTLMVDTSIRKNRTAGVVDVSAEWNEEMRDVVREYYEADFKNFNYEM